ncbi:MAG: DMT family transporter [Paracoccaceae bacterium]
MALNIWALTIVKIMGVDLPAVQIVFVRALIGLVLLAPLLWQGYRSLPRLQQPRLHMLRVVLSTVTLGASFHAVSLLPLALFTAVNFTRPLILMAMAAAFLGERILAKQWIAGAVGLAGVAIAMHPGDIVLGSGLVALVVTVLAGTAAVIVTRRMRTEAPSLMMLTYTGGLAALTVLPALWWWQPVGPGGGAALVLVGGFAQAAQFCFLRAQYWGEAGVLAPLGYAALVFSVSVGFFVFNEVPTTEFWVGAALIIFAAVMATPDRWRVR